MITRRKRWTREAIIDAIQLWAQRHGKPPISTDWVQPRNIKGDEYPPLSGVYRTKNNQSPPFATWSEAIEAAGFPRPRGTRGKRSTAQSQKQREEWTAGRVIRELQEKSNWGHAPSSKNETRLRKAAILYFGSWDEACKAAEVIPKGKKLY